MILKGRERLALRQMGLFDPSLDTALAANKETKHVFVCLHHPRWLAYYGEMNWDEVHTRLAANGNVRAVFAGHIHRQTYSGVRDGIEYLALGTTGGGKPDDIPLAGWVHHFNIVTVRDSGIQMATIPVGEVIDPRQLTEEHLTELFG